MRFCLRGATHGARIGRGVQAIAGDVLPLMMVDSLSIALMSGATLLEHSGALLTLLTPLVTVPLTAITFYVRSLRDQHQVSQRAIEEWMRSVERALDLVRQSAADFSRDFTTKEEWIRECMLARRSIERLNALTERLTTRMEGLFPDRPRVGRTDGQVRSSEGSNDRDAVDSTAAGKGNA